MYKYEAVSVLDEGNYRDWCSTKALVTIEWKSRYAH
jgi:tRNA A37 threonylcarbamoyladenosine biosynthesis protein TsaE